MALNSPPLPRPEYLEGVTRENAVDNRTNGALNIFQKGRLSNAPCRLCIEVNEACIVAPTQSGKCMRCAYKHRSISECLAEGVNKVTKPDVHLVAYQSVFAVEANPTTDEATNPQSQTVHRAPTKQKRKRRVYDPTDAIEIAAKRLRVSTDATVTEHPYAPTAPKATNHVSGPTSEAVTTHDKTSFRLIPFRSVDYDLTIKTKDRVAWAQWASDLHRELHSLRHVQDLGPYTMNVIAMMVEDGVWPRQ